MDTTLLVLDIQNNFFPGGASPVPKREKIVQKINYRMDKVQL